MDILPKVVRDLVDSRDAGLRRALKELREHPESKPVVEGSDAKAPEVRIERAQRDQ